MACPSVHFLFAQLFVCEMCLFEKEIVWNTRFPEEKKKAQLEDTFRIVLLERSAQLLTFSLFLRGIFYESKLITGQLATGCRKIPLSRDNLKLISRLSGGSLFSLSRSLSNDPINNSPS